MSFGLKNAGATFQCLVDQVFLHQIRKNVYAYVDDILVKSKNINDHPKVLEETFDMVKQYDMHLNPSKCSFDIKEGNILGFYVNQQGYD